MSLCGAPVIRAIHGEGAVSEPDLIARSMFAGFGTQPHRNQKHGYKDKEKVAEPLRADWVPFTT